MNDDRMRPPDDSPDDVDRLFARLETAPVPAEVTARVLGSTVGQPRLLSTIVWPWLLATVGGLVGLAGAGYLLGAQLATSPGLDLVEALLDDGTLLASAPGDVLAALVGEVPWSLLLVGAACLVLVLWAGGHALAQPAPLRTQRG
jgi:hypothetical protein